MGCGGSKKAAAEPTAVSAKAVSEGKASSGKPSSKHTSGAGDSEDPESSENEEESAEHESEDESVEEGDNGEFGPLQAQEQTFVDEIDGGSRCKPRITIKTIVTAVKVPPGVNPAEYLKNYGYLWPPRPVVITNRSEAEKDTVASMRASQQRRSGDAPYV